MHTRPWGFYDILFESENYLVKRLVVNPYAKTSLQYHNHRTESWVVASGLLRAWWCIDESTYECVVYDYDVGSLININLKEIHRIENPIPDPLVIIEVQFGNILDEDDIVRLEDDYQRI